MGWDGMGWILAKYGSLWGYFVQEALFMSHRAGQVSPTHPSSRSLKVKLFRKWTSMSPLPVEFQGLFDSKD